MAGASPCLGRKSRRRTPPPRGGAPQWPPGARPELGPRVSRLRGDLRQVADLFCASASLVPTVVTMAMTSALAGEREAREITHAKRAPDGPRPANARAALTLSLRPPPRPRTHARRPATSCHLSPRSHGHTARACLLSRTPPSGAADDSSTSRTSAFPPALARSPRRRGPVARSVAHRGLSRGSWQGQAPRVLCPDQPAVGSPLPPSLRRQISANVKRKASLRPSLLWTPDLVASGRRLKLSS